LSENSKLRIEHGPLDPDDRAGSPDDINRIDEAESQMRKALGLLGDSPRHHRPEPDRQESQTRSGGGGSIGGFGGGGGGLHRRRFVQDGDVPVTVLRRDGGHEPAPHRNVGAGAPAPTSNRLQRTESALTAETVARDKAERALHESQALARDLQTKIGHAELAKNEALDGQRREREATGQIRLENDGLRQAIVTLREELDQATKALDGAVRNLEEERRIRKAAESAQKTAEAALDDAERLIHTLSEAEVEAEAEAPIRTKKAPEFKAPKVVSVVVDKAAPRRGAMEPEPVKWWLNAAPVAKRR
jgi:hypothetical protein